MTNHVSLRPVEDADLDVFFVQERDPIAATMAAFTRMDPSDRAAFEAHWTRIRSNPEIVISAVVVGGAVAGNVMCYPNDGKTEVTYWIGRPYWGRGVATAALSEFIEALEPKPLFARVAKENVASIRVLQKCGFVVAGEDRGYANARGAEIDELVWSRGAADYKARRRR